MAQKPRLKKTQSQVVNIGILQLLCEGVTTPTNILSRLPAKLAELLDCPEAGLPEAYDLSYAAVKQRCKALKDRIEAEVPILIKQAQSVRKSRLEELEHIKRRMWTAFNESAENVDKKSTTTKMALPARAAGEEGEGRLRPVPQAVEDKRETVVQHGDPAYLNTVIRAIREEMNILDRMLEYSEKELPESFDQSRDRLGANILQMPAQGGK